MAGYSTSNPPVLVRQDIGNQGSSVWSLNGTDSAATVDTTGYITNGGQLGMKVNDTVEYQITSTGVITRHVVVTVNATTGAVDLADGVAMTSATNTD